MSKKTGNAKIILSYSVILVACLFLVTFTISSSVIAGQKFRSLDLVSAAEGQLDEINRLIYRTDGLMKDYIKGRDSLIGDEIMANRVRINDILSSIEMNRVREVLPEILRLYKGLRASFLRYVTQFESIVILPQSRPDYSAEAITLEGTRIYHQTVIPERDRLLMDSDSAIEYIRGKKQIAREDAQRFLFFMLVVSVVVIVSLIAAVIPFIVTAATGLFIPRSGINRIMLLDYETDLYNRNYLYETMSNYKNLSDRYETEVGLIAVGINNFAALVEEHGRKNSRLILKSAAATIQHTCRNYDFTARYDGSEFFILTPENSRDNLMLMAKRLQDRMQQSNIYLKNKKRVHIDVSLAIGEYRDIIRCYGEVQVSNLIKLMLDRMREQMRSGGGINLFECDRED